METSMERAESAAQPVTAPPSPLSTLQDPRLIAHPYPVYAALRSTHPVLRAPLPVDGAGVWLLTRHADVQHVLRSHAFSVDRRRAQVIRENAGPLPPALVQEGGGLRSMLFGGEGLFLATLSGHGRVWLQTMPFSRLADRIIENGMVRTGEGD